jgi:hypothetical protein
MDTRMRVMVITAFALLSVFSCSKSYEPKSADIYYRPFLATSVAPLTEHIMITSAGNELHITDKQRLARIWNMLDTSCVPSEKLESDMDLRILIYFNNDYGRSKWMASNFSYFDESKGKMCEMNDNIRLKLSKEFGLGI